LLDEWHQNEFNRDALDSFGPDGKTGWSEFATLGTSFNIRYRVIQDGGANSFNVFNNGMLGPFFLPINNGLSLELQIEETLQEAAPEPGLESELKGIQGNSEDEAERRRRENQQNSEVPEEPENPSNE
ncbi:MAG: hypothetical protein AB7I98_23045, partial [Verrucomicrobiales bacterium]